MPGPSQNRLRAAPFRDDRHYFRRPTRLSAWKVRLAVLALVVVGGWTAVAAMRRDPLYAACTHGGLAGVHAPWATQCDVCHVPFESMGTMSAAVFATKDRWHTFRCEACHAGPPEEPKEYAPHYDRSVRADIGGDPLARNCSSCHHDHRGADFHLTRVADSDCTGCHQDLRPLYRTAGPGPTRRPHPTITAFAADHPEFGVKTDPPRRGLKFNHALHLARGLTEPKNLGNAKAAFTLGKVDPAHTDQYRRFAGDSPAAAIRLDCSACHEPAGGGYKPVTFQQHCRGCHAQEIPPLSSPAGVTTKGYTVPHGRPLPETKRFVRAELLHQIEEQKNLLLGTPIPASDRLDSPRLPVPRTLATEAEALAHRASDRLTCQKCHTVSNGEVRPTALRSVWLLGARFDHGAHRTATCSVCHVMWERISFDRYTYTPSRPDEPVNIPGIETCRQCHAPPSLLVNGRLALGARHDCVLCHRYHRNGRDTPPEHRLAIDAFLRGTRAP